VAHLIGAVAQLGERLLCKQEVIGSIPFGSTSFQQSEDGSQKTDGRGGDDDLSRKKEIEAGQAASEVYLTSDFCLPTSGCLTLWIGCKARLDLSSRAQAGVCWCAAMELGSDRARVNEVAKLCRAVVHRCRRRVVLRRTRSQRQGWMSF
jgi:hypothetical protein